MIAVRWCGPGIVAWAVSVVTTLAAMPALAHVSVSCRDQRIDVAIEGEPFTSYVHAGHRKPILFPVLGPGGVPMTRSWPIKKDVPGEAHDHPHHESIWFTHGMVNGVDFWTSHPEAGKADRRVANRIEHVELCVARSGAEGIVETRNRWLKADDTVVCSDTRRLVFGGDARTRTIDYTVTIHADHGPVTFGDTKEGTLGIRVRTSLQLRDLDGSAGAAGHCTNSEGDRDSDVWGKAARWVDYWGPVDGRVVGVALLDHPASFRHPTHWHARDYGLVAANPFGLHDFAGGSRHRGDLTIADGDSRTLRCLMVFHEGDAAVAGIESIWRRWAGMEKRDAVEKATP